MTGRFSVGRTLRQSALERPPSHMPSRTPQPRLKPQEKGSCLRPLRGRDAPDVGIRASPGMPFLGAPAIGALLRGFFFGGRVPLLK